MSLRSIDSMVTLRNDRDAGLAELARLAVASDTVESTIASALRLLRRCTGADSATFWDTPNPGRLRLAIASGWPTEIDGTIYPIAPDSQAAYVLANDDVVTVDQLADHRFVPSRLVAGMGYTWSMAHRVGTGTAPRGLMSVHRRGGDPFGAEMAPLLETVTGIVALTLDRHRSQEDLRFRAEHDALTGLANRAHLVDALESIVGRSPAASVLLLDLDGFKSVNDSSGHQVGDAVLQCVSARLLELTRGTDLVGRLGGDEFVVIARDCHAGAARSLAERIVGAVEQLITVGHETFTISASVGIADASEHSTGVEVLQAADAAMYSAKFAGRGRVHVATESVGADSAAAVVSPRVRPAAGPAITVADIDAAIERTTVVFQPIVDADTHRVVGVEALARGPRGTRFEQPAEFFAAAETFSRLGELDLAAKRAAFNAGLPDSLPLFVNVDPSVLVDDRCRAALIESWRSSGFGGDVVVELTERSLVSTPGRLLRAIDSCREAGWHIALDDLGARAESLTAMRLVRPDVVKLDLRLVDARHRAHAASVAVAVATHRSRWPLVVVAEGVETEEHEHTARDLGATLLQGFRFGRPGSLDTVLADLHRTPDVDPISWLDAEATWATHRPATKRHLLEVTRVVESMANGSECIVLAALQSSTHYTPRTRGQYAALARRCGMAGVLGAGVAPGVVRGVHHAPIPTGHPLTREWIVVVLAANGGIALVAEDYGDEGVADLDRRFEYRVTRNPAEVEAVANRLLAHF